MERFATTRDAKEFLVSRIVAEAQREGLPLSGTEQKMLYFSETAWTLPNIAEINDAFDRDYDQASYEGKIANLIRNFRDHSRQADRDDFNAWENAVRKIRQEDHYLLVLIDAAARSPDSAKSSFLKLAALGFVLACAVFAMAYLFIVR